MSDDLDKATKILIVAFTMMLVAGLNHGCLQKDRKTEWYMEDEIMHWSDSVLNEWTKRQMAIDTFDTQ